MATAQELENPPEIAATIRIQMIAGEISRRKLAFIAGLKVGTVTNLICGSSRTRRGRRIIEWALGRPFWNTDAEFNAMMAEIRERGRDHVFGPWSSYRKTTKKRNAAKAITKSSQS